MYNVHVCMLNTIVCSFTLHTYVQKQDRVDELQEWTDRHKYHVQKLEVSSNCLIHSLNLQAPPSARRGGGNWSNFLVMCTNIASFITHDHARFSDMCIHYSLSN